MVRKLPVHGDDKNTGKLFRMKVFARDEVAAKARVWNNLNKLVKLKKTNSELVSIDEIKDSNNKSVKNVGIWLRYDSRCKTHNMYREYRDTSIVGAVNRCFTDMAGKHRARADTLHILKVDSLPASKCKRPFVKQFHQSKIAYPLTHRVISAHKSSLFTRHRPNTFI